MTKKVLFYLSFLFAEFRTMNNQMNNQTSSLKLNRKNASQMIEKSARKLKSGAFWRRKLPCIDWARNYDSHCLKGDLIAGLTTALTVIPQGIGYAMLAGLQLQVIMIIKSLELDMKLIFQILILSKEKRIRLGCFKISKQELMDFYL